MKRIHLALAVRDFEVALRDYSARLGAAPYCTVEGTYALWRTDEVNLSISVRPDEAGTVRHLGFEDSTAGTLSEETDGNGFVWERFALDQQREEILKHWPHAKFARPSHSTGH